ncbi:RluA family pseudouridine synthase [Companilactobacillus paralimentarius]|uniref:RluA family pseudouridine synthase n=1 Tax=Companilactobacillus paralimentarius TaxID=83526 RepID=UPI000468ECB4|nr:RluA family pseudouridine synthase [Companilactobacillus paralimentarius]MDR4934400.1 RluA family pseudouridine synthase [Companilactobacillus paralimentarius]QFR68632.1 RluA family pseudouridine synthase [Companilactobacillus paralimentarius]
MYQKKITYHSKNNEKLTLRELLKKWLIPKKWQHLFRIQHDVLINDIYQPFNTIIKDKDVLTLNFNFEPRTEQHYLPGHDPIDVAYEDDDIIVVNKQAGKKTHPNRKIEDDSLMNDVENYLQDAHPYMVHRIDMETSGLVLIAKTPYLVPIFNRQLSSKTLHRQYLAVVKLNQPIFNSGTIDLPIGQDPTDVRKRMVTEDGLNAITEYEVIKKNNDFALLKLNLQTGRTHQLRVHLSHMGWPIVNDPLYNSDPKHGKLLLFADKLTFEEPFTDNSKIIKAKLSKDMYNLICAYFKQPKSSSNPDN